jgi:hypothetical protein
MPPKKNLSSSGQKEKKKGESNEINIKAFFSQSPKTVASEIPPAASPGSDPPTSSTGSASSETHAVVDLSSAFQAVATSFGEAPPESNQSVESALPTSDVASTSSSSAVIAVPKAYSKRKSETKLEEPMGKAKKESPASSPASAKEKTEKKESPIQAPLRPEYVTIQERLKNELSQILREPLERILLADFEPDVTSSLESFRKEFPDSASFILQVTSAGSRSPSECEFPKQHNLLLCLYTQDSALPLGKLVQQISSNLFVSLSDSDATLIEEIIASGVRIIAKRENYGLKDKKLEDNDKRKHEDCSPNSVWLWECVRDLLPKEIKQKLVLLQKPRKLLSRRAQAHNNVLIEFEKKSPSESKIDEAMKKVEIINDEIKQIAQKELEEKKRKQLKEEAALAQKVHFSPFLFV